MTNQISGQLLPVASHNAENAEKSTWNIAQSCCISSKYWPLVLTEMLLLADAKWLSNSATPAFQGSWAAAFVILYWILMFFLLILCPKLKQKIRKIGKIMLKSLNVDHKEEFEPKKLLYSSSQVLSSSVFKKRQKIALISLLEII